MGLKPGDLVVMNDRYFVSEANRGRVWTVRSLPWNLCGSMVVLLAGKAGGYAVDGLDPVNGKAPTRTAVRNERTSKITTSSYHKGR